MSKISEPTKLVSNLSDGEIEMIQRGKKHWRKVTETLPKKGEVNRETIENLMDLIVEDVWSKAEEFYTSKKTEK